MTKVLFKETQKFTQWWLWLIMSAAFGVPIVLIALKLIEEGRQSDDYLELLIVLSVTILFAAVFVVLFLRMKLFVALDQTGIRFRFPPMLRKWKTIPVTEIERFEVRQYRPVFEYGGWGIKGSSKNKAYNVKGNIGLQLHLNNGKKVLLGTQRQQSFAYAMEKLLGKERKVFSDAVELAQTKPLLGKKVKKVLVILGIEIVLAVIIISLIQYFR